ncbi:MAG: site-specific integrase, partial [Alistipes sp.]|nr:site-specific integrase [Alistipes sp.]
MLEEFLQYLVSERRFSPLTVSNYRRDVERFTQWIEAQGGRPDAPETISANDLRAWIVRRSEQGIGAASINRELSSLRSYFRYLHRQGVIRKEPLCGLHALKAPKRLPSFVPTSRMETLLDRTDRESRSDSADDQRDALIVQLFYSCGLRLAELVAIDRDDFSGDYTALKVRGKGDKERL